MARFCSLFSGSSGNCSYIGSANAGILIDAGVSAKRIETALIQREIDPACIGAVFVTHEHRDHIAGLKVLAKRYGYKIYGTPGTLTALAEADLVNATASLIPLTGAIEEAGMQISPFATSHDSAESCGFRIHTPDGRSIAIATDTGVFTPSIEAAVTGCDMVLIESNHDVHMVQCGAYPQYLKQRILSPKGHLSNEACAEQLSALAATGTTRFVLGHLSRENNRPELARLCAEQALERAGMRHGVDYLLTVAEPISPKGVTVF